MVSFTPDQWLVLLLAFVLGLVLGMAFLANPKWKKKYRDEAQRRQALEAENQQGRQTLEADNRQLRRDAAEMDSLRQSAVRDETRNRDDETGRRDAAERESLREAAARDEARRRDDETPRRDDEPGPR